MKALSEVVHVLDEGKLLDAESYEHRYATRRGASLMPGYYVVTWAVQEHQGDYDEWAQFFGPFLSRAQALSAVALSN